MQLFRVKFIYGVAVRHALYITIVLFGIEISKRPNLGFRQNVYRLNIYKPYLGHTQIRRRRTLFAQRCKFKGVRERGCDMHFQFKDYYCIKTQDC